MENLSIEELRSLSREATEDFIKKSASVELAKTKSLYYMNSLNTKMREEFKKHSREDIYNDIINIYYKEADMCINKVVADLKILQDKYNSPKEFENELHKVVNTLEGLSIFDDIFDKLQLR